MIRGSREDQNPTATSHEDLSGVETSRIWLPAFMAFCWYHPCSSTGDYRCLPSPLSSNSDGGCGVDSEQMGEFYCGMQEIAELRGYYSIAIVVLMEQLYSFARHKRGCKKSSCLKKYCECYQGGVGCSINCRCEGCKNAFGRIYASGSLHVIMESKHTEDHEIYEKRTAKIQHNSEVPKEVEQIPSSDQPSTPMTPHFVVHQPFLSKNRLPPTQFFLGAGSSSSWRKADGEFTQSRNEKKKTLETVAQDKIEIMTEILITCPITTIKAISPNSKRVSSPHPGSSESGSILGKRSNDRKLILRSIPAFPSLNPN
ncbi:unnamed protein product [Microthlaspi erraticum]|uniref:CRC domain-containing protein n=1 Tax=Microthlaspi erraticum TaxID=1685480 RepID=A0A6D2JPC4_9BRAS|nr:unnamed protein product [Microthlaspi erraticum]